MKILTVLLAVIVAIGAAVYYQRSKMVRNQAAIAREAQAQAQQASYQVRELEAARAQAERDKEKLLNLTKQMGTELDRRNLAASNQAVRASSGEQETNSGVAGFGAAMAKMMKDPETKKFIRDQQRIMMDSMYAPLIRQMGLNAEEGERFKDFLADQAMKATDSAAALMGGATGSDRKEQLKQLTEKQKGIEQETKDFLGEERYAQYQDYQVTLQERVQLNMFRQQVSGEDAISDAQAEQLLAVMKEEKKSIATEQGLPVGGGQSGDMGAMLSEDMADKLIRAQETVNQRVYQRATDLLQPGQLSSFARFQTNQLQTVRMGLTMARKMFGN